jgi:hypothetical protein
MGTTAGTGGEEGRRKGRRRRRVNLDGCRLLASSSRLLSLLSPGRDAAGDDEAVLGNRQRSEVHHGLDPWRGGGDVQISRRGRIIDEE